MKNGPNPFPHRVGVLIPFIKKFTSPLIWNAAFSIYQIFVWNWIYFIFLNCSGPICSYVNTMLFNEIFFIICFIWFCVISFYPFDHNILSCPCLSEMSIFFILSRGLVSSFPSFTAVKLLLIIAKWSNTWFMLLWPIFSIPLPYFYLDLFFH